MSSSLPGVNASDDVVKMEPIEIEKGDCSMTTCSTKTPGSSSLPSPEEYATDFWSSSSQYLHKSRRQWWRTRLAGLVLLLFTLIVVVVPTAIFGRRRRRAAARNAKVPTVLSYLETSNMLLTGESLDLDVDSPQYKAARWLAEEDPANLPVPTAATSSHEAYRYLVRYVLVM